MRNTAKLAIAASAVTLPLLSTGPAFATAPDGNFHFKDNANSQGSCIGVFSSVIIQNGQFVGSGNNIFNIDQTTAPGSRAALVHAAQAGPC